MSVDVSQIEIGDYLERVTKILDQDRMDRFEKVGRILITQGAETQVCVARVDPCTP